MNTRTVAVPRWSAELGEPVGTAQYDREVPSVARQRPSSPEKRVHFALDVSAAPGTDAVTVVAPTGELDMASAPRLRQELMALASDGRTAVVLDLAGVDFMDSTGLGVILGALKRLRAAGGDLTLARAEPQVAKVFEITRLDDILPLHPTIDAAVMAVVSD